MRKILPLQGLNRGWMNEEGECGSLDSKDISQTH
jgi:hypothetical protein